CRSALEPNEAESAQIAGCRVAPRAGRTSCNETQDQCAMAGSCQAIVNDLTQKYKKFAQEFIANEIPHEQDNSRSFQPLLLLQRSVASPCAGVRGPTHWLFRERTCM